MRYKLFGLALMSAATLSASDHELDLQITKQMTRDFTDFKIDQPTGWALKYGYDVVGLGPAQLQLQAGYHAQTTADIKVGGTKVTEFKNTGYSLGLQAQWRMGVVLGAGAELRAENLKAAGWASTTQVRPWVTGRVGFSVPLPIVQPVFGLELAIPMTNQKADSSSTDEDVLKRLSPNFEVSVYGGIRF